MNLSLNKNSRDRFDRFTINFSKDSANAFASSISKWVNPMGRTFHICPFLPFFIKGHTKTLLHIYIQFYFLKDVKI